MGVKLHVRVQEARHLAPKDSNGFSDPYVRLHLGSSKAKSKIIYKNLNPIWNEEFFFNVEDPLSEQLHVTVWDSDFGLSDDFLGQLYLPLSEVYESENRTIHGWHILEQRKAKEVVSGEILLTLSLIGHFERSVSSNSSSGGSASFSRRPSLTPPSDYLPDPKSSPGGDVSSSSLTPKLQKGAFFQGGFQGGTVTNLAS